MKFLNHILLVILVSVAAGCNKHEDTSYQEKDRLYQMMDMLRADTSLSITVEALDKARLSGTLNTYGPFTLFAPDNNAFRSYLKNVGKAGIADFTSEEITTLMVYHILGARLRSADFIPGPQSVSTGRGDYIALDISKGTKTQALANGKARLYETDIEYSNGLVHKMDAVLDPPILTIGAFLQQNPQYSVLKGGLQRAGLMDTLLALNNAQGEKIRLTLFAETNEVLAAAGITTFDNMPIDELKDLMLYHLVPGSSFTAQYAGLTAAVAAIGVVERWDNTLSTLSPDSHIYYDMAGQKPVNSAIDFRGSDILMKNGVLHNLDKHMVFSSAVPRTQITHVFTENVNYLYGVAGISPTAPPIFSTAAGRFRYFAETSHPRAGATVLYIEPDSKDDSLISIVKNVRKGKYKISINYKNGNRGDLQLMYGNDKIGPVKNYGAGTTFYQNMELGIYEFTTGGDKRFKFVSQASKLAAVVLDVMILTPVN
ncbi:fasciclin domain-containing protein [Niastella sp. OAS944]|uniref:fasciclin domain-containing protein n=1 Tax=Niastella sp. OAS944 TaxID=2664089 RepID=UPI003469BA35|nr:putative surface protein with fasciclin (FAS1) repeats [Chitinophagaceae bacterium OAS944]